MPEKQYHIALKRGEVANNILLCGDTGRAERIAQFFDRVLLERKNREFITYTGRYRDIPVTVMSTGIGAANTEIALIELSQIVRNLNIIRVGTCGGLQKGTRLGDLVISTGALRMENTSLFFVPEGYPAVAHYEVVRHLENAAKNLKVRYHLGLTATAPGFYGAQGRIVPGFALRTNGVVDYFRKLGVLNFEMETSTLLTLAQLKNYRAGSVCTVVADRYHYKFIAPAEHKKAELNCIKTALKAVELLTK